MKRALVFATLGALGCSIPFTNCGEGWTTLTSGLRRAFADSARANGIIGAQLAVSVPGRPLWTAEWGEDATGVSMTADRLLGTGSISKMLAAVSVLRLVDRGALSMSDTLGRWFSAYGNVPPGIPVRALLWHQSGLPEFAPAVNADRDRAFGHASLVKFIGRADFAPATQWRASNSDRLLLGLITAAESNMTYGEYLRREMFTTGNGENWTPGDGQPQRTLGTHWAFDGAGQRFNFSDRSFGPSLFTARYETYISARDLTAFARRMFDGDLLSAAGRAQLTTIVPDDGRIPGETGGGVGIRRFEYFGRTMWGNSGATPNSSALYLYDAESKVIVTLSTNMAGQNHGNSHFRIVPALIKMVVESGLAR